MGIVDARLHQPVIGKSYKPHWADEFLPQMPKIKAWLARCSYCKPTSAFTATKSPSALFTHSLRVGRTRNPFAVGDEEGDAFLGSVGHTRFIRTARPWPTPMHRKARAYPPPVWRSSSAAEARCVHQTCRADDQAQSRPRYDGPAPMIRGAMPAAAIRATLRLSSPA